MCAVKGERNCVSDLAKRASKEKNSNSVFRRGKYQNNKQKLGVQKFPFSQLVQEPIKKIANTLFDISTE